MTTNGDAVKVVPVRHVGRWIAVGFALLLVAMLIHTLFSKLPTGQYACHLMNGVRKCHQVSVWRFSWTIVGQYFTTSEILHGLLTTLELTVLAMIVGIVLGVTIAIMRLSPNRLLSSTAWTYTWFFRGTPVLVQLLVWYNIAILYPVLSVGVPFTHLTLVHFSTNTVLRAFEAAVIGLGLNEEAYMSEIARAGLIAFTLNLQGGSPYGYSREQPWRNSAFAPDGSLRADYFSRLEKILDRADELGMVAILGCFYQAQDLVLTNETAVIHAMENATVWVLDHGYRNVIVEINNECDQHYVNEILRPERVHELILSVQKNQRGGFHLLASTSCSGPLPKANVATNADFILVHGNGVRKNPARITDSVRKIRAMCEKPKDRKSTRLNSSHLG